MFAYNARRLYVIGVQNLKMMNRVKAGKLEDQLDTAWTAVDLCLTTMKKK